LKDVKVTKNHLRWWPK